MPTTTIDSNPHESICRRGVAWGEMLTLISLCSVMGLTLAFVGPRLLRGSPATADASEVGTLSEAFQPQQAILKGLLSKSNAALALHFAQDDPSQLDTLVLWTADDRYPGDVNLSEVLVLRFSPLLRSIIAYTWTPDPVQDVILSDGDLGRLHSIESLANRTDVVRAVIAQPVVSCEVTGISPAQPARPDTSVDPIVLRLTWLDESTDTRDVSVIRTDLHLRAGASRH